ncbi:MAG TPA: dTMP kinase [Burkholderiales bacterium]|nr:dTMP kinase [Burkholderiales bacterium]
MRGLFLTLEGVDGAGKSSHVQYVADTVRASGRAHVIVTREPGGTDLAERLREAVLSEPMSPLMETLLVFAARADHVAKVIRPALEAGTSVVCDRFTDATLAYQGAGKGVPEDLIRRLAEAAHPGLAPDRTLVFDCPYEVSRERLGKTGRALDRFEREDRAFYERVRAAYLERARAEPGRVRIIDASQDFETVRKSIQQMLKGL